MRYQITTYDSQCNGFDSKKDYTNKKRAISAAKTLSYSYEGVGVWDSNEKAYCYTRGFFPTQEKVLCIEW